MSVSLQVAEPQSEGAVFQGPPAVEVPRARLPLLPQVPLSRPGFAPQKPVSRQGPGRPRRQQAQEQVPREAQESVQGKEGKALQVQVAGGERRRWRQRGQVSPEERWRWWRRWLRTVPRSQPQQEQVP